MKIIFVKKVDNHMPGEIKEVASGFARNYLIPLGLAVIATDSEIKKLENQKQQEEKEHLKKIQNSQFLKEKLEGTILEFQVKSEKSGKIFGSITEKNIADKIEENIGIKIPKRDIKIKKPLKELGEHQVELSLEENLKANLRIKLIKTQSK